MNKEKNIGDLKFEIELAETLKEAETYEKKNSEIKERKNVKALGGYFVIATLYFMMGLYAINQTLNFGKDIKIVLIETVFDMSITMIMVGFAIWILTLFFKFEEYQLEGLLGFSLLLILLIYLDSHYLKSGTIKSIISEQKYFFYLITLPANGIFTVKLCMAVEEKWSLKSNLLGLLCFISWNVFMEYVVATQVYFAYHGLLVFTNALIVGSAIFNAKTKEKHNGNRIAMTFLYFVLMLGSLYLKKASFVSIREILFDSGREFQEYAASVQNLLCNAKMIGVAFEGYSWELVNLLDYSSATIQSLLGYFGIVPAGIYILLLIIMMIIFAKTLHRMKDKDRVFYAVGLSAYAYLNSKTILGVCYELGLLPLKMAMPFSGANNVVDFCCCAMLLIIYFDTKHDEGYVGPFDGIKNTLIQKILDFYILEDEETWEEKENETMD